MQHEALKKLFGGKAKALRAQKLRQYMQAEHWVSATDGTLCPTDGQLAQIMAIACGKALAGNVGGLEREQTVLTPPWFLDALTKLNGPIWLDPATTPENPTDAKVFCTEKTNGLIQPWHVVPGYFYLNPPFNILRAWLEKARLEWVAGARGYMLAPKRSQRVWFSELTRGLTIVDLKPFAFVGHKQAFPAPLCLICYSMPAPTEILNARGRNIVIRAEVAQ